MTRRHLPLVFVGLLLACTSIADAVWWSSVDDDADRIRLGLSGLVAIAVVWASAASTGLRAGVKALAGLMLAAVVWGVAAGLAPFVFEYLKMGLGIGDGWTIHVFAASDGWLVTAALAFTFVLLAGVVAQRVRARSSAASPDLRLVLVALPFATLALAAAADGAQVQALIAVASATWVTVAVRHLGPVGTGVPVDAGALASPGVTTETHALSADLGRRKPERLPVVLCAVSGVVLVVVAILWWTAYAPLVEVDEVLGGLITASGTPEYDGALVMPIMVCAALVAAAISWAASHRNSGRAAVAVLGVLLLAMLLEGTAIDRVAGEMETSGPQDIAGMPFAPMGIGLWAVVLATAASVVAVAATRARAVETSLALIAFIVLGFGVLASELFRSGEGRASEGFAVISVAAGVWLACTVWALRRRRQAPSATAPVAGAAH